MTGGGGSGEGVRGNTLPSFERRVESRAQRLRVIISMNFIHFDKQTIGMRGTFAREEGKVGGGGCLCYKLLLSAM